MELKWQMAIFGFLPEDKFNSQSNNYELNLTPRHTSATWWQDYIFFSLREFILASIVWFN